MEAGESEVSDDQEQAYKHWERCYSAKLDLPHWGRCHNADLLDL